MSSDHEAEIRASVGAHYDLGSRYDDAVAEGLVERIGAEIDKRIDARLGQLGARAGSPPGAYAAPGVPGVPGSPAAPDVPPGTSVPLPPGAPPLAVGPAGAAVPSVPVAPSGYQGYQAPPGYQVPPGYSSSGYQGYPGYPGYPGYQGYHGPVPPAGYQGPAPGAGPPPLPAHRSVAFTVTALGSMAFGVLATAVVSRALNPGAQAIMVLLIWTAIVIINITYSRRR
jgi:hypothetical protein